MDNTTQTKIFIYSLADILKLDKISVSPTNDLSSLINQYCSRNIICSFFIEYIFFKEYTRFFYLLKFIFINEVGAYVQATVIFHEFNGMQFNPESTNNILKILSIWENDLHYVSQSKSGTNNTINFEDFNHQDQSNNFFILPHQKDVYLKYHSSIGNCNIKSLHNQQRPELNIKKNYILFLDIKDWLKIKLKQIFIYNDELIGSDSSGINHFHLPKSIFFKNRNLFKKITSRVCIGSYSKWGNLRDFSIIIELCNIVITHTYDYYQNDNARDYTLLDKIKITDLMTLINIENEIL